MKSFKLALTREDLICADGRRGRGWVANVSAERLIVGRNGMVARFDITPSEK